MTDEYPFYTLLPEGGKEEAQALIDDFKKQLIKAAQEAISNMYCDVTVHIESDSWYNYRNKIMDGFRNYKNKIKNEWNFKVIRAEIFRDFHDEIIKDLNQDLLEENAELKKRIEYLGEYRRS